MHYSVFGPCFGLRVCFSELTALCDYEDSSLSALLQERLSSRRQVFDGTRSSLSLLNLINCRLWSASTTNGILFSVRCDGYLHQVPESDSATGTHCSALKAQCVPILTSLLLDFTAEKKVKSIFKRQDDCVICISLSMFFTCSSSGSC